MRVDLKSKRLAWYNNRTQMASARRLRIIYELYLFSRLIDRDGVRIDVTVDVGNLNVFVN